MFRVLHRCLPGLPVVWVACMFPLASCGSGGDVRAASSKRPSILMVSVDSLRRDRMSLYGHERNTTPLIDSLAESSLVFERAYTTANWSLIANMSLATGTYPRQHGVIDTQTALPKDIPTLAERLREAGYHTIGLHVPGWLDERYGFARGFDHYEEHWDAEEAEEHLFAALASRPADRPVFLFAQLYDVHNGPLRGPRASMYDPPAPFDRIYLPDARLSLMGVNISELWTKNGAKASFEQREAISALYDGCVRYVDHKLGRMIERLDEMGLFEDTILVFTAGHGEGFLDHSNIYRGHGGMYEEGLRVPLIVRLPGGERASRVTEPVSLVDVVPTILDHLDLEVGPVPAGRSLLSDLSPERLIFAERKDVRTIISMPYKLTEGRSTAGSRLTDLSRDPLERKNLIGPRERGAYDPIYLEILARANAEVASRFVSESPRPPLQSASEPPAPIARRLRALGFQGEAKSAGAGDD